MFGGLFNSEAKKQEAASSSRSLRDISLDNKSEAEALKEIRSVLDSGASADELSCGPHSRAERVLEKACEKGWLDVVQLLVERGASVNPPEGTVTPLMYAAKTNQLEVIEYLLEKGANPLAREGSGDTSSNVFIYFVGIWSHNSYGLRSNTPEAQERDCKILKLFLDRKVPLEEYPAHNIYKCRRHLAPLLPDLAQLLDFEKAVTDKNYTNVKYCIDQGINPKFSYYSGYDTGLCIAGAANDVPMMQALCMAGADLSKDAGSTSNVLHAATKAGAKEAFLFLAAMGADTSVLYAYDRYPDTTVAEVAGYHSPDMRAFVERVIADKAAVLAEYPEVQKAVNLAQPKKCDISKRPYQVFTL